MSKSASFKAAVGAAGLALLAMSGSALADGFYGGTKDAAAADEGRKFSWSVTGTGTSDYVFRGYSLNNEDPAFQASIDAEYGIWYAGLWGTMAADDMGGPVELNFYTGIKPVLGPVTFDFGIVYYFFPWEDGGDSDLIELKAGFDWSPVKNLTLTPTIYWAPDQSNVDEYFVYEGTAAYELPAVGIFTPTISGTVGFVDADLSVDDYTYWNVGLALAVEKFTFDFRYWDTDISNDGLADERFVFTASVTLP